MHTAFLNRFVVSALLRSGIFPCKLPGWQMEAIKTASFDTSPSGEVDQRAGHRCLRSQGALGHTRRTVGSGGALLAALQERAEIMQGETGCCFANRFIFCYQIFGRLFICQGQGLAPHDISVLNGGNGEQSQD